MDGIVLDAVLMILMMFPVTDCIAEQQHIEDVKGRNQTERKEGKSVFPLGRTDPVPVSTLAVVWP